ncbi:hypothetical protein QLX08_002275 [Tetragonisca angustula]|uniref:Uncharacterized protein n=1 Tax=Tetragonisca angustula TaxID=166442 RepID=A0AAW1ABN0_9HYME
MDKVSLAGGSVTETYIIGRRQLYETTAMIPVRPVSAHRVKKGEFYSTKGLQRTYVQDHHSKKIKATLS